MLVEDEHDIKTIRDLIEHIASLELHNDTEKHKRDRLLLIVKSAKEIAESVGKQPEVSLKKAQATFKQARDQFKYRSRRHNY